MITKESFDLVANVLAEQRAIAAAQEIPWTQSQVLDYLTTNLAIKFKENNPRFNTDKWLQAADPTWK